MRKKRDMLIAICFALVLCMIPAATLVKMAKNRIPIEQYKGAIVGRYPMIKFNTMLTEKLTGGTYMESQEVLLGKDEWLFYKVKTDGTPLYDYMGINRFSEEELAEITNRMESLGDELAKRGIDYAVMTVPNKEQVYSEYMPDTIARVSETSRLEQLTDYIDSHGGRKLNGSYPYIDVSEELFSLHAEYPLYYKTDTHWTQMGSFVALSNMMEELYGKSDSLSGVTFSEIPGFEGDLPRISGTSDRFKENDYVLDADSVDENCHRDEVLFIIGDSFGDAMIHVAKYYYDEVYWVRIKDFSPELLDEYDPDVVLWECVERYLPDMYDYRIVVD